MESRESGAMFAASSQALVKTVGQGLVAKVCCSSKSHGVQWWGPSKRLVVRKFINMHLPISILSAQNRGIYKKVCFLLHFLQFAIVTRNSKTSQKLLDSLNNWKQNL